MENNCPKCGLPKELCTCETLAREVQKIKIYTVRKRFKKFATIIDGIGKDVDGKEIMKTLKRKFACGGTYKNDIIELQGNHKDKIKEELMKLGFSEEQIEIK